MRKAWSKKYGYLVIDTSKEDLNQKYRCQLEIENSAEIPQNIQIEAKKQRATKTCKFCNLTILSSSHAKHVKSKMHLENSLL